MGRRGKNLTSRSSLDQRTATARAARSADRPNPSPTSQPPPSPLVLGPDAGHCMPPQSVQPPTASTGMFGALARSPVALGMRAAAAPHSAGLWHVFLIPLPCSSSFLCRLAWSWCCLGCCFFFAHFPSNFRFVFFVFFVFFFVQRYMLEGQRRLPRHLLQRTGAVWDQTWLHRCIGHP